MLTRDKRLLTRRSWTTAEAFEYCEQLARDHYENFPVASILTPRDKRPYVYAVYSFARMADDYADEPGLSTAERIDSLVDWEEQLQEIYRGNAHHPVFIALRETIERFEIPIELFQDLLSAFRSDVTTNRYESFDDLLIYCSNSANPIGRLVLLLYSYRNETLMEWSDSICTALQLANFWQDVSVDLQKDRVYIPLEDIREFGYSEEELFARKHTQSFKDLMCYEVDRTRELFKEGKQLIVEVGKDLRLELRLTWSGGMQILKKIEKSGYNVLAQRPALNAFDKMSLLVSSLRGS